MEVLNSQNDAVSEDNPKMQKDSTMLADISNIPKPLRSNSLPVKQYIDQLQKENAALMKAVADKNKIIDLSAAELHKMRITLQKMQQQNLHLAHSNSQMLAELNSGKERLKDLQHQLGCKNGVLIAKQLELEGKRKNRTCETNAIKKLKVSEHGETGVSMVPEKDKGQHCNTIGKQKSKSLGPSVRKAQDKGVVDNGRFQARRQSARFKNEEPKPIEDSCHTNDADLRLCPLPDDKTQEDDSNSVSFSVKKEDDVKSMVLSVKKEDDSFPDKVTQERRSSISRPSRVAAQKVQSYKEISLHVKLRRPE